MCTCCWRRDADVERVGLDLLQLERPAFAFEVLEISVGEVHYWNQLRLALGGLRFAVGRVQWRGELGSSQCYLSTYAYLTSAV